MNYRHESQVGLPLREVAGCLLLFFGVSMLVGGSCSFSSHHDDDDHHNFHPLQAPDPVDPDDPYVLQVFETRPVADPATQPVPSLFGIEGLSVFSGQGEQVIGPAELKEFTDRVLEANHDLLGLPKGAGTFVFDSLHVLPDSTLVSYRHEHALWRHGQETGDGLIFVFDALGRLREIDSRVRIPREVGR